MTTQTTDSTRSEAQRVEALALALLDELDLDLSDEQAKRILRLVDVRDPLRVSEPADQRHLTQTEQRVMDGALRRSVTIAPDPREAEIERLRAENARLRAVIEGLTENNWRHAKQDAWATKINALEWDSLGRETPAAPGSST